MTIYIAALWKAGEQSNIDDQPIIITAGCLRQAAKDHPELEFNEEDQTLYATAECKGNISLEVIVPNTLEPFTIETVLLPPQDIETCTCAAQFREAPDNLEPPDTTQ